MSIAGQFTRADNSPPTPKERVYDGAITLADSLGKPLLALPPEAVLQVAAGGLGTARQIAVARDMDVVVARQFDGHIGIRRHLADDAIEIAITNGDFGMFLTPDGKHLVLTDAASVKVIDCATGRLSNEIDVRQFRPAVP